MTPSDAQREAERLLDFFYRCPVGLVSFDDEGMVTDINPAAVNLLVPALGITDVSNVFDVFAAVWPALRTVIESGGDGRVVDDHHLRGGDRSWALACTVVRLDAGQNMMVVSDATARVAAEDALRASEQRFHLMADQMPLPMWSTSADGRPDWANDSFTDFFGVTADDVVAGAWRPDVHPDDDEHARTIRRAVRERAAARVTLRAARADGEMRWLDAWVHPRFSDASEYLGHLGAAVDVTERTQVEHAIRESEQFTRRVLDSLFAFVGVMTTDGTLIEANRAPLEAAGLEPADVIGRKFWDCYWWSYSSESQTTLRRAVDRAASGEAVRYDALVRVADDGRLWIDFALVPLRDGAGNITHLIPSGLDLTERKIAEQQRAELLASEQRARHQVELLERSATHLAAATTVEELAQSVLDDMFHSLGLDLTSVNVVEGDSIRLYAGPGLPEAAVDDVGDIAVDSELPGASAIRSDEIIHLATVDEIAAAFPIWTGARYGRDVGSLVAVPIRSAAKIPLGALVVAAPKPHWFDDDAVALLVGMAGQTGLALERAQLFERVVQSQEQEHAIADRLQRALLPERFQTVPGVEVAARVSAATAAMAVGGDWFDTFTWPTGEFGVIVGDVVGHDLEAAAAMGRMRAGAAAIARLSAASPGILLERLDEFARIETGAGFSTAFCAVLDATAERLTYSAAGHPPALVQHSDGRVVWLDDATGPPLGALPDGEFPEAAVAIAPGARVVVFTDGLVERRDRDIAAGMQRLESVVVSDTSDGADALADRVFRSMTTSDAIGDDVAVVAVVWRPDRP